MKKCFATMEKLWRLKPIYKLVLCWGGKLWFRNPMAITGLFLVQILVLRMLLCSLEKPCKPKKGVFLLAPWWSILWTEPMNLCGDSTFIRAFSCRTWDFSNHRESGHCVSYSIRKESESTGGEMGEPSEFEVFDQMQIFWGSVNKNRVRKL